MGLSKGWQHLPRHEDNKTELIARDVMDVDCLKTTFSVARNLFDKFVAALDKQKASLHFPARDIASALIEPGRLPKRSQIFR
jgi:hypothetical protein